MKNKTVCIAISAVLFFAIIGAIIQGNLEKNMEKQENPFERDSQISSETDKNSENIAIEPIAKIRTIVEKEVGATHNMRDVQNIKALSLSDDVSILNIEYRLDENFTINMMRDSIYIDLHGIFCKIYTQNEFDSIRLIKIGVYYWLKDKYGQESEEQVARAVMSRDLADKINWGNLLWSDLPNLLVSEGEFWMHPSFKNKS